MALFFCQSFHTSSHHEQQVSDSSPFFFPAVSLHLLWPSACETLPFFLTYSFITDLIPWPTVCEWHYHFSARYSFHQWPTGSVWHCPVWLQGTSHLTNRKWVMLPCKLQSHHISSHDHIVCEWHYIFSPPGSLTIHHAMTNSLWATLWCILFWQTVSHTMTISLLVTLLLSSVTAFPSHLIPWSTESALGAYSFKIPSLIILYAMTNSGSEWYCHFAMQSHYIRPTVCEWHCLKFFQAISSHLIPWPTVCEWHCPFFCKGWSHIVPWPTASECHCQGVWSCLIPWWTAWSEWYNLFFCQAVSSYLVLWWTESEWPCTFCHAVSSHHIPWPTACEWCWPIFPGNLITSHSVTKSMWATWVPLFSARQSHAMHCAVIIDSKSVPLPLFSARQFCHLTFHDRLWVSKLPFFLPCNLIRSLTMTWTTRMWVALCQAVSSCYISWPTGCE